MLTAIYVLLNEEDEGIDSLFMLLSGPPGKDLAALEAQYRKARKKPQRLRFISWLIRYRGFKRIAYAEHTLGFFAADCGRPRTRRTGKFHNIIDRTIKRYARAQNLEDRLIGNKLLLDELKQKGKVQFDLPLYGPVVRVRD